MKFSVKRVGRKARGGRPINHLVVVPRGKPGVLSAVDDVEPDEAYAVERRERVLDVVLRYLAAVPEDQDAQLARVRQQAPLIVSVGEHPSPEAKLEMVEAPDLAMLE